MCGEQITEERCTIRKPSGAGRQQIVFADLTLLYFLSLIEHVLSTDTTDPCQSQSHVSGS